jgi:hypothetical protein
MSFFTQSELRSITDQCAKKVVDAKLGINYFTEPYRHLVIDNFFTDELADICLNNFPSLDDPLWEYANDKDIEIKYRTMWKSEFDIPEGIVDAVRILNSAPFLKGMSKKFGIEKIVPDAYFTGGGLNATKPGGLLDVHVDGNYHDATGLNRRLNVLLYLNPGWRPEWGGEFGIYDDRGEVCIKKIEPLFNRLVIFDSHDKSYHGLPAPLNFPDGEVRRSILLYYYTKEARPKEHIVHEMPHSALWKKRGLMDKRGNKTRKYS